ncbi:MAG TPA: condensation domain-containing protein [Thermoguttaceae bacterium]|nr:condensation domain-containing protein [Thermoguttaceae bacterium]
MVFPLPLAPMEQYMLADDWPAHPRTFYLRLGLEGQFDHEALERAVPIAMARHPLLGAVVQSEGRRTWWVAAENQLPQIHWEREIERDIARAAAPIDLRRQIGLRLWVCEADGRTRLWLELHHACCDGLGAVRFAEDLLAAYAAEREGGKPEWRPLRTERLRDRGIYAGSRFTQWLRWPFEVLCIAGSLEYFLHRPVPLAVPVKEGADGSEPSPRLAAFRHRFTIHQTEALRSAARQEGATLNDLLLRDLFLAAQDWIDRHRAEEKTGMVRIMVPVNLRTRLHADMPAADCVCMINVDRRVQGWTDLRKMLRIVSWEMGMVKRLRLGVIMLRIIQLVQRITGSLKSLLPADRCLASCVLSNLGMPLRDSPLADAHGRVTAGNVEVEEIELLPPVRPLTSAAFGAATLGGRLTVSLLADQRALGAGGGEELLALYAQRLGQTAQPDPPATSDVSPTGAASPAG